MLDLQSVHRLTELMERFFWPQGPSHFTRLMECSRQEDWTQVRRALQSADDKQSEMMARVEKLNKIREYTIHQEEKCACAISAMKCLTQIRDDEILTKESLEDFYNAAAPHITPESFPSQEEYERRFRPVLSSHRIASDLMRDVAAAMNERSETPEMLQYEVAKSALMTNTHLLQHGTGTTLAHKRSGIVKSWEEGKRMDAPLQDAQANLHKATMETREQLRCEWQRLQTEVDRGIIGHAPAPVTAPKVPPSPLDERYKEPKETFLTEVKMSADTKRKRDAMEKIEVELFVHGDSTVLTTTPLARLAEMAKQNAINGDPRYIVARARAREALAEEPALEKEIKALNEELCERQKYWLPFCDDKYEGSVPPSAHALILKYNRIEEECERVLAASGPFDVLQVTRKSNDADISVAYKKISLLTHPDRGGRAEAQALVAAASEQLMDPDVRKEYEGKHPLGLAYTYYYNTSRKLDVGLADAQRLGVTCALANFMRSFSKIFEAKGLSTNTPPKKATAALQGHPSNFFVSHPETEVVGVQLADESDLYEDFVDRPQCRAAGCDSEICTLHEGLFNWRENTKKPTRICTVECCFRGFKFNAPLEAFMVKDSNYNFLVLHDKASKVAELLKEPVQTLLGVIDGMSLEEILCRIPKPPDLAELERMSVKARRQNLLQKYSKQIKARRPKFFGAFDDWYRMAKNAPVTRVPAKEKEKKQGSQHQPVLALPPPLAPK